MTWPASLEIGDARLVPGQPLTNDLMSDYRDRDDLLLEGLTLLNLGGQYYDLDLLAWTWSYPAHVHAKGSTETMWTTLQVYVPVGVTKLSVSVLAASEDTSTQQKVRVTVGADYVDFWNLPAIGAIAWQTPQDLTFTGVGVQNVVIAGIETHNVAMKDIYCYGVRIRVADA